MTARNLKLLHEGTARGVEAGWIKALIDSLDAAARERKGT
jgi:hypothetical protein